MFEKLNIPYLGVIENMSYMEDPTTKEKSFPFGNGGWNHCRRFEYETTRGNSPRGRNKARWRPRYPDCHRGSRTLSVQRILFFGR